MGKLRVIQPVDHRPRLKDALEEMLELDREVERGGILYYKRLWNSAFQAEKIAFYYGILPYNRKAKERIIELDFRSNLKKKEKRK